MSNRKFLAFLLTSAALALSAPEAWAAGSAKLGMASLSPEFLKWREDQAKIRAAGGVTKTARNYGVRPSPLNLAHLSGNPVRVSAELGRCAAPPQPVNLGNMLGIRDCGSYGDQLSASD